MTVIGKLTCFFFRVFSFILPSATRTGQWPSIPKVETNVEHVRGKIGNKRRAIRAAFLRPAIKGIQREVYPLVN